MSDKQGLQNYEVLRAHADALEESNDALRTMLNDTLREKQRVTAELGRTTLLIWRVREIVTLLDVVCRNNALDDLWYIRQEFAKALFGSAPSPASDADADDAASDAHPLPPDHPAWDAADAALRDLAQDAEQQAAYAALDDAWVGDTDEDLPLAPMPKKKTVTLDLHLTHRGPLPPSDIGDYDVEIDPHDEDEDGA